MNLGAKGKEHVKRVDDAMKWTGERYLPFIDPKTIGAEIHYEHLHRYAFAAQFVKGKTVLDLASGEGYGSYMLSQEADNVVGVEMDPESVGHARTKYPRDDLKFMQGSILEIPIAGEHIFDVAVCFEAIEHVNDHDKLLSEVKRLLKNDGLFIVSTPNKKVYTDEPNYHNQFHVRELYFSDFIDLLSNHFSDIYSFGQRVYVGSNIWRLSSKKVSGCAEFVVGKEDGGFSFKNENEKSPLYFIAIASNSSLGERQNINSHFIDTSNALITLREGNIVVLTGQLHELTDIVQVMEKSATEREVLLKKSSNRAQVLEQSIAERDSEIIGLTGQLQEKSSLTKTLELAVADRNGQIAGLNGQLQEESSRTKTLELAVADRDGQIAGLNGQLQQASIHAAALEREISEMERSIVWRITTGFHNCFVERALPHGTRRRGWYDLGLKGGRILANEGSEQATQKFKEYRRTQKKNKTINNEGLSEGSGHEEVNQEDNIILDLFDRASIKSSDYVEPSQTHIKLKDDDIKLIAFYLPQFHPIPENDQWWGNGFTDWINVTKSAPQFKGHHQPQLPECLGFYDLRIPEVQETQVELAKQYGIYGFCFHYYWFNGKRLLETPLNQFLGHNELDLKFCICWANENWTRRWDGQDNEILIAQTHSPENDIAIIEDLEPLFRDSRYIRINGKPLVIVYRVMLLPDPIKTAKRWREYCKQQGIGDLYLVAAQGFGLGDPRPYGFDAAVEFPPQTMQPFCNNITHKIKVLNPRFCGDIYDCDGFVKSKAYLKKVPYKLFKTVSPGWDNTARRPNNASIFYGLNPETYKEWLSNVVEFTRVENSRDERIVFINAWNEWAEGAHLEPDRKYGYGYLQATSDVILDYRRDRNDLRKIIYVSHDAYYHGAQMLSVNIVKLLKEQFHYEVYVILKSGGPLENEFTKYAIVYNLEKDFANREAFEKLIQMFYHEGAKIAICNTVVSGDLVELFNKYNIKTISLIHELPGIIKQYGMEENAKIVANFAEGIIFPSEFVKSKFSAIAKLDEDKCIIAPQGLYLKNKYKNKKDEARNSLRSLLSIPNDSKIILSVAYADFRKGVDLFVETAKIVIRANPAAYFVWVGHHDENLMQDIILDIKKSGIENKIIFVGLVPIEKVGLFYAGADLYLMTSREDPFPSTVLDAMDVEVPVIGFRGAGGFEDIITNDTGVLVPYLDINEMAKEVIYLLNDQALRINFGKNASALIAFKHNFVDYVHLLLTLLGHEYKKVSVILPNYNYERYLEERFRSIFNQTYPIHEIIFLDDCSSDQSVEVARKISENSVIPVKILLNEKNSGSVFRQWAKGMGAARGNYVWIAEADDLCEPSFLQEAISGFSDDNIVLSYTQSKQIDQNGHSIDNDYLKYTNDIDAKKWKKKYLRDGIQEISDTLAIKNTIPNVSAVVLKKYNIAEIMDELVRFKVAGDWFFYVWLLQKGRICFNEKSLNLHRRHERGVTSSENAKLHYEEIVKMQEYIKAHFKVSEATLDKMVKYRIYIKNYLLKV